MMKSTRSSTESLITGATSTSSKFRKLAIRAWQRSQKIDTRNDLSDKPKELQDELDGDYYLGTEEEWRKSIKIKMKTRTQKKIQ